MEALIYDYSQSGRRGHSLPASDVPERPLAELIPDEYRRRADAPLPEVAEPEVVRHFIRLSTLNYHVDRGLYPLGSCTMKYNPKVNEDMARLPGFARLHPLQPESTFPGALQLMGELGADLCTIAGLDAVTLQPAAGAQGELTGILIVHKHHEARGRVRTKVLVPDSAHGTNPASVTLAGYTAVPVKSDTRGLVDLADLTARMDEDVACLMLTNPNTLGLFETDVRRIAAIVHDAGGLLYFDGANLNALLGITRPGDQGFDIVHFNLHKTFSTPHGGGGPGSGPVAVRADLERFLPVPVVRRTAGGFAFDDDRPASIGKLLAFYGNVGILVRAYTYIRMLGAAGLRATAEAAILNANYLRAALGRVFRVAQDRACMHEFVLSGDVLKPHGVRTLDVAKRLLDHGFHAPTIYFPLIVPEALMIEPTETESRETLDAFIAALTAIADEAARDPDQLRRAPVTTPVRRLDEARAARELDVRYRH